MLWTHSVMKQEGMLCEKTMPIERRNKIEFYYLSHNLVGKESQKILGHWMSHFLQKKKKESPDGLIFYQLLF